MSRVVVWRKAFSLSGPLWRVRAHSGDRRRQLDFLGIGPTMESLRCSLLIVLVIACRSSVGQALPALRRSGDKAQHASGAAAASPHAQPPFPGPWAFQCALQGWEKASCLQIDGCAWCDTDEYGGACVTESFAERVTRWSDSFHCQEQPEQHNRLVLFRPNTIVKA